MQRLNHAPHPPPPQGGVDPNSAINAEEVYPPLAEWSGIDQRGTLQSHPNIGDLLASKAVEALDSQKSPILLIAPADHIHLPLRATGEITHRMSAHTRGISIARAHAQMHTHSDTNTAPPHNMH